MTDYKQPDFYRFNEDSIKLVRHVASEISGVNSILDLGAGSGIIGIELANLLVPKELTLLEVQPDWREYLEYNIDTFLTKETKARIVESSFSQWMPDRKYDLIVSNPPYYLPGHGQPNTDQRKHISRSFVIDGWNELFGVIQRALSPEGKAFLVVKNDPKILNHIRNLKQQISFEETGDVVFLKMILTEYR